MIYFNIIHVKYTISGIFCNFAGNAWTKILFFNNTYITIWKCNDIFQTNVTVIPNVTYLSKLKGSNNLNWTDKEKAESGEKINRIVRRVR